MKVIFSKKYILIEKLGNSSNGKLCFRSHIEEINLSQSKEMLLQLLKEIEYLKDKIESTSVAV